VHLCPVGVASTIPLDFLAVCRCNIYTDTSCDICEHSRCNFSVHKLFLHLYCTQTSSPDAAPAQPKSLVVLQMLHLLSTDEASDGGFGHLACLWLQHLCFSSFFWGRWLCLQQPKNRCHTYNQISTLRPGYCTIINIKSVVTY